MKNIVQNGATPDFETGVTAVLLTKLTTQRPLWSPATVEEVSPEIVSRFFDKGSEYLVGRPKLSVPDNLAQGKHDPMRFALPTEEAIAQRFKDAKSGIVALPDLLSHFAGVDVLRLGKQGAREKVLEVLERRCEFVDTGDEQNRHWVRWAQLG